VDEAESDSESERESEVSRVKTGGVKTDEMKAGDGRLGKGKRALVKEKTTDKDSKAPVKAAKKRKA
jgi:hypothetical protein